MPVGTILWTVVAGLPCVDDEVSARAGYTGLGTSYAARGEFPEMTVRDCKWCAPLANHRLAVRGLAMDRREIGKAPSDIHEGRHCRALVVVGSTKRSDAGLYAGHLNAVVGLRADVDEAAVIAALHCRRASCGDQLVAR